MGALASQITSLTIVYSSVYSCADQSKHQSSASLAFVRGIHRWPVNTPHKWPVTRKMFPFDDVYMGDLLIDEEWLCNWLQSPVDLIFKSFVITGFWMWILNMMASNWWVNPLSSCQCFGLADIALVFNSWVSASWITNTRASFRKAISIIHNPLELLIMKELLKEVPQALHNCLCWDNTRLTKVQGVWFRDSNQHPFWTCYSVLWAIKGIVEKCHKV